MASPMRERRAWPTRDRDVDSTESAAFAQHVAVVKQTVAQSGEVLSSANEDLSEHQRWLQAQTAAVEADRARHERWLQRQREHREAVARCERTRRKRQLMRQRIGRSINRAVVSVVLFVRSLILLAIAKTLAGIAWVGARLRDFALYLASSVVFAALWTAAKIKAVLLALGRGIAAGVSWLLAKISSLLGACGQAVSAGAPQLSATTKALVVSTGQGITSLASSLSTKAHAAAASLGQGTAARVSSLSANAHPFAVSVGQSLAAGFASLSAGVKSIARPVGSAIAAGSASVGAKFQRLAPSLHVHLAKAGEQAKLYAGAGAAQVGSLFASRGRAQTAASPAEVPRVAELRAEHDDFDDIRVDGTRVAAPMPASVPEAQVEPVAQVEETYVEQAPVVAKNALSLPLRTGTFDLSQMLILAGVVLLICGGLLLGSGLVLRAAGTAPGRDTPHVIAWLFEEPDRPLDERIVFTLSGSPADFRINGLSITGENASDQPMTDVEGVVKPDVRRPDLKLAVGLVPEGDGGAAEAQAAVPVGTNGVPGHSLFKLTFPFPPEAMDGQDGLTVDEFAESYGGLTLRLRYEVEGRQKAVIQYLSPEMLKAQLAEVKNELDGS
jgi:hypothetical protein